MENVAELYHQNLEKTVRVQALTELSANFERRASEYEQKIGQANSKADKLQSKVLKAATALKEAAILLETMDRIDTPEKTQSARRKILNFIQATLREIEIP